MLEPTTKELGGENFQFLPIPTMKAARLNKKVLTALAPVIGGLFGDGVSLTSEVDMEGLSKGLTKALQELDDITFTALLRDTLTHVTWIGSNGAVELGTEAAIDQAFSGKLDLLFKVTVEAWRYNKFVPFAQLGEGGGLAQILTSAKPSGEPKGSGLRLAQ